jgi:hypothetical protein
MLALSAAAVVPVTRYVSVDASSEIPAAGRNDASGAGGDKRELGAGVGVAERLAMAPDGLAVTVGLGVASDAALGPSVATDEAEQAVTATTTTPRISCRWRGPGRTGVFTRCCR